MRNIVIFGATSAIASATARRYAVQGDRLFLVARETAALTDLAADLRVRGAVEVITRTFDAAALEGLPGLVESLFAAGHVDIVLIAHGTLSDQAACEADSAMLCREWTVNALSYAVLLNEIGRRLAAQQCGVICVISSVAGERGRASNYVYGSAKAAVTAFTSGLRGRLKPQGVAVVTIKPGFVDTPMTAAFKKGPLWASPETVAAIIEKAIERRSATVYAPWFWRGIMSVIKGLPEPLFQRLKQ